MKQSVCQTIFNIYSEQKRLS